MDITYIHGLEIHTIIGIFDWERKNKQTLFIDLDIASNFSNAISSDNINDCIDYTQVSKEINKLANQHSYQLLESFAEQISQIVLQQFHAHWVRVKINKPLAIDKATSTGVIIERSKKK
ncbi:MAG: dihydroneopterin aldolase [Pseudomonadota bacterium]